MSNQSFVLNSLERAKLLVMEYNSVHDKSLYYKSDRAPSVKKIQTVLDKDPGLFNVIHSRISEATKGTPLTEILNGIGSKKKTRDRKVDNKVVDSLAILEKAVTDIIMAQRVPEIVEAVLEEVQSRTGPIHREIIYKVGDKTSPREAVLHEKFHTVTTLVLADEPTMLVGPAGSGKNVLTKQVADTLGLDFYFSNAVTQEYKLTGFIDANGKYHETEFYRAFTRGGLFMLDEIDASIPEVLIILNAAIANRYFDFPTGKVQAHPDFRVISAGNTTGNGANNAYVGRNQLDGASLNRFSIVHIGYSEKIESSITSDKDLLEFVRCFRGAVDKMGVNHIVSYRDISRLNKLMKGSDLEKGEIINIGLLRGLEKDDLNSINAYMSKEISGNDLLPHLNRLCHD